MTDVEKVLAMCGIEPKSATAAQVRVAARALKFHKFLENAANTVADELDVRRPYPQ